MSSFTANLSEITSKRTATPLFATVHPTYARSLFMLMRQHGVDAESALAQASLSEAALAVSDQPVTLHAITLLAQQAMQATGKPWLGLMLGHVVHASAHGLVGHAALTSRDLREMLQTITRYAGLRTDALRFAWSEAGDGGTLTIREAFDLGPARQFVIETVFSTLLVLLDTGAGQRPNGLKATLPFAAPPWRTAYLEHCRLDDRHLRFGDEALTMHLPRAGLQMTCITADVRAHEAACQACEGLLQRLHGTPGVAGQVRDALEQAPPGSFPPLNTIAKALHRSPRTLMRQLQREGVRFQALLDEVRKARALNALHGSHDTVEAIAAQLGFVDTSNFSRTCRRWFGQTPGAIRAGALQLQASPAAGIDSAHSA